MRSAQPGDDRDSRPPVAITAAPSPGGAGRRSVWRRPSLTPRLLDDGPVGFPAHHPYVRRFWTAALGPGAVTDLLRLIAAAIQQRPLPRPDYLPLLTRAGLVFLSSGTLWVGRSVPPLGDAQLRRLPPAVRAEHSRALARYLRASEPTGTT
jgi:hypothetical protein